MAEGRSFLGYRDTHVFHLYISLQAVFSQLSPVPRGFVATKGGLGTKHIIAVYPEMETRFKHLQFQAWLMEEPAAVNGCLQQDFQAGFPCFSVLSDNRVNPY